MLARVYLEARACISLRSAAQPLSDALVVRLRDRRGWVGAQRAGDGSRGVIHLPIEKEDCGDEMSGGTMLRYVVTAADEMTQGGRDGKVAPLESGASDL